MRQVLNWVGGGFFRTIGRTLAFLALGALAYYLFSKSSFDIKDLFFEKVNAAVLTESVVRDGNDWLDFSSNNLNTNEFPYGSQSYYSNDDIQEYLYPLSSNIGLNTDYVAFHFLISQPLTIESTSSEEGRRCLKWSCSGTEENSGPTWKYCTQYTCTQYGTWTQGQETIVVPTELKDFNISFRVVYTDNSFSVCQIDGGVAYCPTNRKAINEIRFSYSLKTARSTNFKFSLNRNVDRYKYTNIEGAINNQTQQQEQQHNETMTYFQDTNSTETDETATSFFDDFQDTDHGGLSSIITAPLVVINEMLNGVCVQPSATWKGATISLPCGDLLWSRNGASDLKNLLNIFYGGVICYYAIRKLFMMIEGLKDPTQDRIEVTDL